MCDESPIGYRGLDNLEVMSEAKTYNAFLLDLAAGLAEEADRIVDFGAGIGTFAKPMSGLGHTVICVEPDAGLGARLRAAGLRTCSDVGDLPDGSVDYCYTFNVLEHIADDERAVSEVFRALRPGGRLLAYVPAFQILLTSMDRNVGHRRRYRLTELVSVLSRAGFCVEKAEYVDFLGFFAALLFKALDRGDGRLNRSAVKLYDRCVFPLSHLLDAVFRSLCGKNLLVVAGKP